MFMLVRRLAVQLAAVTVVAGGALGLAAMPAAAASACDTSQIQVQFLGIGASNTVLVAGPDGYFTGNVLVHVYCGLDNSLVTGAIVNMWTTVAGSAILDPSTHTWLDATNQASPVSINDPSGDVQITIRTSTPNLSGWNARVGTDTVTVTQAFGQAVNGTGGYPTASAGIWAQTPELDSLALFGSGALGLIGYSMLRRRSSRGKAK